MIGYTGGLDPWKIDVDLLVGIARARRDWSIALAGYVWFGFDASRLEAEPNIQVLGPQDYVAFPGILKGFDVGLLPFPYNEITRNGDALKAYEYLAAGLPVVGRDVPVMRRLLPGVRIAEDVEGFVDAIESALAEPEREAAERAALAARHSWDVRTAAKLALVRGAMARNGGGLEDAGSEPAPSADGMERAA